MRRRGDGDVRELGRKRASIAAMVVGTEGLFGRRRGLELGAGSGGEPGRSALSRRPGGELGPIGGRGRSRAGCRQRSAHSQGRQR